VLKPGATVPELDRELQAWTRRVQSFARDACGERLRRLRVRLEDKEAIAALHWRGVPDEEEAQAAVEDVARRAEQSGFTSHWGRKVLEIRPPVEFDKGRAVRSLVEAASSQAALFAGDDTTDLDAFDALRRMQEEGALEASVLVGVRSDEGPPAIVERADLVVDGVEGFTRVLAALDGP
jgi:trehalose 6-phosphate phosphatase